MGLNLTLGNAFARLSKLMDVRKARGKYHSLTTILMAKLCGEISLCICGLGKERKEELVKLLFLERQTMPNYINYCRILAHVVCKKLCYCKNL